MADVSRCWIRRGICSPIAKLLSAGSWTNGALISLTAGIGDPLGTTRATRVVNGGDCGGGGDADAGGAGELSILLEYVGEDSGRIERDSDGFDDGGERGDYVSTDGELAADFDSVNLALATASVTFGAQLAAGATVDLFGMQVEAQLAPSDYKMTGTNGGVYSSARFASDSLTVMAQSTDVYDATIRIVRREVGIEPQVAT